MLLFYEIFNFTASLFICNRTKDFLDKYDIIDNAVASIYIYADSFLGLRCIRFIYTVRKARMEGELRIVVKWSGKEYDILDIQEEDTVLTLKERIHRETGVRPERQKLLNLKFKGYVLRTIFWFFV